MKAFKDFIKKMFFSSKAGGELYLYIRYELSRFWALSYFFYDLYVAARSMRWSARAADDSLEAQILFFYHKIEKGMSLPGDKRLFALDVVPKVFNLLESWEAARGSLDNKTYVGAINCVRSYLAFLDEKGLDPEDKIMSRVRGFLGDRRLVAVEADTPVRISKLDLMRDGDLESFRRLCEVRRSVRDFSDEAVSLEMINRAVELAQMSPSACNRQPSKVYAVTTSDLRSSLLSLQNGNAGFGHLAPVLLVVTATSSSCFNAIERAVPYVDGGLFSMSLLYALQAEGLVSCCLNWCVPPAIDVEAHSILDIPLSERIVMLILAGHPVAEIVYARSQRKNLSSVLCYK